MTGRNSGETVVDRAQAMRTTLSGEQLAAGLALTAGLAFLLFVVQEPLVHDAMHNFRHAAGITCH